MEPLKRDNHFVPQAYLKRWSTDGTHIWAYRLLVSAEQVPLWRRRAISGLAYQSDLYTSLNQGAETDAFERWIEAEFETPAEPALRKVESGEPLKREDWTRIAYYAAAQNLRTPAAYLEHVQRMHDAVPELLNKILPDSIVKLERARKAGRKVLVQENRQPPLVPLRVTTERDPDGEQMFFRAEATIGRQSWLASVRHLLTGVASVLVRHTWSIVTPHPSTEWFTSDHPLVRLNYSAPGTYDFKGGWGNPGTDILMPLSPRHLLYTQVGKRNSSHFTVSADKTFEMQRILAEHAHRWIFASKQTKRVSWFRPRHVDAVEFKAEADAWARWHSEQSGAESED
jgi:hypothetical protein